VLLQQWYWGKCLNREFKEGFSVDYDHSNSIN